jgi:serine/threonine protein kinase
MKAPLQVPGRLALLQQAKRESADPFDLLGDVLDGQYRVESFAGEGELSVIYKGHHIGVDAPIAIKCLNLPDTLHPALARPLVEGFKEASRIHYRLARGNLHIAQAIASGSTLAPRTGASIPYLVREWFEGESLASELARRRKESRAGRPLDETLALLETAFEAVSHAHGMGEIHLALNPTNLFLARSASAESTRTLKVLDFGTAGTLGALGSAATPDEPPTGLRLMLPAYAAPEQLERTVGKVGPWTDVYTLALVMLEVLSDRIVMNTCETGALVERALDAKSRPTPQSHGLKLPAHVDRALVRAVARAPEARQSSAAELWREVSRTGNVISLPRALPEPPRPLPKPPLVPVPMASAPIQAEVEAATIPVPSAAPSIPSNASPVIAAELPEGFPPAASATPLAAAAATSAPAIPQAPAPSISKAPRQNPLIVIMMCLGLLKPLLLLVRDAVVAKLALWTATCRRFVSTRPRDALFVGAAFTFLLPVALSWRLWSSTKPSKAVDAVTPSAEALPAPLPSPTPTEERPEPAPIAPSAPTSNNPFNRDLALRALDKKWRDVAKCRRGKTSGKGWTTVTFAEDGSVKDVVVGPPFFGTPTGQCIADTLANVHVQAFTGDPPAIDYRVYVAAR